MIAFVTSTFTIALPPMFPVALLIEPSRDEPEESTPVEILAARHVNRGIATDCATGGAARL